MRTKVGFLGAGRIARVLAGGLVRGEDSWELFASSRTRAGGEAFRKALPQARLYPEERNRDLVGESEIVFLCVRPQEAIGVLRQIRPMTAGKRIVSVAAGVSLASILSEVEPSARVVRAMPNLPSLIGQGVIPYCLGSGREAGDREWAKRLLERFGEAVELEESLFPLATALIGCGPAYVCAFLAPLLRFAAESGLRAAEARRMVLATVSGALALLRQTDLDPAEVVQESRTPGGITNAAVSVLEEEGWQETLRRALDAAWSRAKALEEA
ncbi:pyrroline-5-carboxylate reductase [Methylacidimicrobium sp. B4]|uniref:pyrroline-5-carboxylate reductase family protein n=1 Tax=Methylacidimicrobium sp. B4 TaxID=2796139 RepID=UPI001A8D5B7A|nr:pyrroline-5-carboxylate reductase [Methylacidimicrobium sp. B4]QSR83862.1 pyrroline-5-carboxylate reductase [Methylacidimicrobium sp. B4]